MHNRKQCESGACFLDFHRGGVNGPKLNPTKAKNGHKIINYPITLQEEHVHFTGTFI